MEEIDFPVMSESTGGLYVVRFFREGSRINAICSCPSGENGGVCKHRLAILSGNNKNVVKNAKRVCEVAAWLPGSNLSALFEEIANAEADVEKAKKHLSLTKKKLAKAMNGGV